MKIGLVLQCFDPARGGLEQWTYNFARGLIDQGHDVHVVAKRFGPAAEELALTAHALGGAGRRFHFARASQSRLMSISPDIIHDMGFGWFCDVFQPHIGSWFSLSRRRLESLTPLRRLLKRGFDELSPRIRRLRDLVGRQYADRGQIMIALSDAIADDFRKLHGVPGERIRVVRNGVDVDHFSMKDRTVRRQSVRHELGITPDESMALIVTQNFRLKGIPGLMTATARLAKQGKPIRLVVVGGKNTRVWKMKAWRMGIARQIDFVGMVDDPRPYYAAADYYVMPTLYDACSLVVLEAAASGLPIITSRRNGAAEMFKDGHDCLLLDNPSDIDELTTKMLRFSDAGERIRLGGAARRTAEKNTFETNVDKIVSIYEHILRRRSDGEQRERGIVGLSNKRQVIRRFMTPDTADRKSA